MRMAESDIRKVLSIGYKARFITLSYTMRKFHMRRADASAGIKKFRMRACAEGDSRPYRGYLPYNPIFGKLREVGYALGVFSNFIFPA